SQLSCQLRHKSNVRWLTLDGTAWIAGRRPAWARAARQAAGRDDARRAVLTGARLLRAPRPPASGGWGPGRREGKDVADSRRDAAWGGAVRIGEGAVSVAVAGGVRVGDQARHAEGVGLLGDVPASEVADSPPTGLRGLTAPGVIRPFLGRLLGRDEGDVGDRQ